MMNDLVDRAARLETTVAGMAANIYADRGHRLTRYVRALDFAADALAKADPSRSASEWRSWALSRASVTARGKRQASRKGCNG